MYRYAFLGTFQFYVSKEILKFTQIQFGNKEIADTNSKQEH